MGTFLDFEKPFWQKNKLVAGIDEVGRGCLAGPVVAAAVVLPRDFQNELGINDSKQVPEKKRIELSKIIENQANSIAIHQLDNREIDRINIRNATLICMQKAVDTLPNSIEHAFIDGNYFVHDAIAFTTVIKGDAICLSIAAASIVAKVWRDTWMKTVAHESYPEYGFDKHKGYATQQHLRALEKFGPCELHRKTFLRKFHERQLSLFTKE